MSDKRTEPYQGRGKESRRDSNQGRGPTPANENLADAKRDFRECARNWRRSTGDEMQQTFDDDPIDVFAARPLPVTWQDVPIRIMRVRH